MRRERRAHRRCSRSRGSRRTTSSSPWRSASALAAGPAGRPASCSGRRPSSCSTAWSASASPRSSRCAPGGSAEPTLLPARHHLQRRLRRGARADRSSSRWPLVGFMIGGVTGDLTALARRTGSSCPAVQQAHLAAGAAVPAAGGRAVPALRDAPGRAGSASRRSPWAGRCRSPRSAAMVWLLQPATPPTVAVGPRAGR